MFHSSREVTGSNRGWLKWLYAYTLISRPVLIFHVDLGISELLLGSLKCPSSSISPVKTSVFYICSIICSIFTRHKTVQWTECSQSWTAFGATRKSDYALLKLLFCSKWTSVTLGSVFHNKLIQNIKLLEKILHSHKYATFMSESENWQQQY